MLKANECFLIVHFARLMYVEDNLILSVFSHAHLIFFYQTKMNVVSFISSLKHGTPLNEITQNL